MRYLLRLLSLTIAIFLMACHHNADAPHYTWVKLGDTMVHAKLSITEQEHIQGLQNVNSLAPNEGMLFVYQPPRVLMHWMKNMRIPLDMIWISSDKKILGITENAPACKTNPCQIYTSPENAAYVLEVNAGFANTHHLHSGMTVLFNG